MRIHTITLTHSLTRDRGEAEKGREGINYVLQKKAAHFITLNDTYIKPASAPLFQELNILNIHDIFKVETLKFVYECINKTNPLQFHNIFSITSTRQNTAYTRNNKLVTPQVRTSNYGLKSINYTGAFLWNEHPGTICSSKTKKIFSKKLKKELLKSYSNS